MKVGDFVVRPGIGCVGVIKMFRGSYALVRFGSAPSDNDFIAVTDLEVVADGNWTVDRKGNISRKGESR